MPTELYLKPYDLTLVYKKYKSSFQQSHRDKKYLILFTNHRSGSNFFMNLIGSLSNVDNKNEMLEHHQWKLSPWSINGTLDVDRMICDVADNIGSTIPFYKVHFRSFRQLVESATYRDFLLSSIPIFLTRTDLLAQAISLAIAEQTYAWESGQSEQKEPVYDARIISRMLSICLQRVLGWQQFFAYNNIVPFHLSYEALCNNPNQICHDLCSYAKIDVDADFNFAQDEVSIQRKRRNEDWRMRFLNDTGTSWLNLFTQ